MDKETTKEEKTHITSEEIKKMFLLSRLAPPEEGLEKFVDEFNSILEFFSALSEVDTSAVEELAQVHDFNNAMRPDEAKPAFTTSQALANAPDTQETSFRVPLVIEG
jgi:aspartyl-tRNA(Asn)/glutamyl-tRNA(Gln) amidotransferase subunit C